MNNQHTEIERKFLVKSHDYRKLAQPDYIAQGYLNSEKERTVRVRIQSGRAWLTVKSLTIGIERKEFEYSIPADDGRVLLRDLCEKPIIEKNRYTFVAEGIRWEVDEFLGANEGLIVAEVEVEDPSTPLTLPPWIGAEVSNDPRYYNSNLAKHPFHDWVHDGDLSGREEQS